MKWNKTSEGYPNTQKPVLVRDGHRNIYAALAVWVDCDDGTGWVWEVTTMYHSALNDINSYELDDDYEYDEWMALPE